MQPVAVALTCGAAASSVEPAHAPTSHRRSFAGLAGGLRGRRTPGGRAQAAYWVHEVPKTILLLPPPQGQTSAGNAGLPAAVHMYVLVLHRDLLPSARAVALEGLHLRREGA